MGALAMAVIRAAITKAKAMADQLTSVSKKRLINKAGTVSTAELEGIKRAISIQLDL